MALVLNEEQQMLRESASTFLQARSPVSLFRELRDTQQHCSPKLWKEMVEMGWSAMVIDEVYDGLGFGYTGAGLVAVECGRTLATSPLTSTMVCARLVADLGSDAQKKAWLPAIASGDMVPTLALNESSRFTPEATMVSVFSKDNAWVINGTKTHVIDIEQATHLFVVARSAGVQDDEDGLSVFAVKLNSQGLTYTCEPPLDNRPMATVQFDSVLMAADSLLGIEGQAWAALLAVLEIGAVLSAAELLGVAQGAFAKTISYLQERKQFGVPIGSFQALQHRAAELFCELELTQSAVLAALQAIDSNDSNRAQLASVAKVKSTRTATLAVNEAVQMHGGMGMTDQFDVGFFMKRAAVLRQQYGDDYYHANRFAELGGY